MNTRPAGNLMDGTAPGANKVFVKGGPPMDGHEQLSPLAMASRNLVIELSKGADPAVVEAGCYDLLTKNTNGLGSADIKVVEVASEIVRGVLSGAVTLRSPAFIAAARGMSQTGLAGRAGDAQRLDISERTCREVRDSDYASPSDYTAALVGAAPAARLSVDELRTLVDRTPRPDAARAPDGTAGGSSGDQSENGRKVH